jgi:hypothetical protein
MLNVQKCSSSMIWSWVNLETWHLDKQRTVSDMEGALEQAVHRVGVGQKAMFSLHLAKLSSRCTFD